jgi:hypothetical protein
MMSKEDSIAWQRQCMVECRAWKEGVSEVVEDFVEVKKLGQGFSLVDELKEVNLGEECATRPTYVNASLPSHQKARMCTLLNEFMDCFTWDCTEMPELC